jgi:apolipoprotein N-acyltransferase
LKALPAWAAALAAAALGALQTLAYVHTGWWLLPLLTLVLLVTLLDPQSPRQAALTTWCYGLAWLVAGVWWLFISMHFYGGLPAWLAVLAVLALSGALSLYMAAAGWAYARWRRGQALDVALFAALWLLAELARGVLFTGFPWVALGYSQLDSPLAALAPWLGVYGVGAVAAALACSVVLALTRRRLWPVLTVVLLVATAKLGPDSFTTSTGSISVALLQPGVKQNEKFAAEQLPRALEWLSRELLAAQVDLVVTPETAMPLLPQQLQEVAPGYWAALQTNFARAGRVALVGLPLGDFDSGYTNSVTNLGGDVPYRYDKLHLVPFGEFIPTGFRWFTELMNIPLGDFARGIPNPPSLPVKGQRIGPNICYEDLFGEELARRFIDPALAPTVLANVSNIGWFGDTIAIPQHLNISRMRSLELQRPMLRATNTGATAVVDHLGRVSAALPAQKPGVLTSQVSGRQGTTPFAWWAARFGLWPLFVGAALTVLTLAVLGQKQQRF